MIEPHHLGICVSDLERSLRFWCDGLGFEQLGPLQLSTEWSDALEIGGEVRFTMAFISKGGFMFELLEFEEPSPHGAASTRRDRIGLTHLAVTVDDIASTVAHLEACGGSVIGSTRTKAVVEGGTVELVFVSDPDGVRVELTQTTAVAV